MTEKTCTKCGETKAFSDFRKHRNMKDGLQSQCKVCRAKADKAWRLANPEKFKAGKARCYQNKKEHYNKKSREWAKKNPERKKEITNLSYQNNRESKLDYSKRYREENAEICAQRIRDWELRNLDRCRAKYTRRRTAKLNAIPPWLTDTHKEQIDAVYSHARDCEMVSGEKYHVDHIIPLQGKNVCGLHVPWNLQVLPADLNIAKGNRFNAEAEQIMA